MTVVGATEGIEHAMRSRGAPHVASNALGRGMPPGSSRAGGAAGAPPGGPGGPRTPGAPGGGGPNCPGAIAADWPGDIAAPPCDDCCCCKFIAPTWPAKAFTPPLAPGRGGIAYMGGAAAEEVVTLAGGGRMGGATRAGAAGAG